ncbi:MAG TPA: ABC-F family ATP-binding cassette domain-containing protein [Acidimicrobiia bacterium]|nr:ABC-F family ATP-binding cassette domain-containing protein [Acidimicrobiia bacterium]
MLTGSGLSKAHGQRVLFSDVTVTLSPGRRVALVGGNGTGKTTLLEILSGEQRPDSGTVTRPSTLTTAYLPQDRTEAPDGSALDEALRGAGTIVDLAHRIDELHHGVAATTGAEHDRLLRELGDAQTAFEQHGGYAIEAEAHRVLAGLGFTDTDRRRPLSELSGGWRMRAALARILVARPDVLLLDEPTNHLDVDSVAWLEQQLAAFPGALLFVSHDRDFIDGVANRVLELSNSKVSEFVGGFVEYVAQREERIAQLQAAAANQARQVAATERFVERFRYKATKARQVQSRVKALEKLDAIEVPTLSEVRARFQFPEPPRVSRVVAELENVTAGYDDEVVLRKVNLVVERGMRIGLVGPNGAGKTTLLRLLLGEIPALSGRVSLGANVEVGRFAQHQVEVLRLDKSVVDEFRASVPEKAGKNLRTYLGAFGFSGDAVERKVGDLSGGERTRLALGKLMIEPHNLLVLDEPTNHLDLPSCDLLEDALRAYEGTILLVTHDRALIRGVCTSLIEVRRGTARFHHDVDERVLTPTLGPGPAAATPAPRSQLTKPSRRDDRRSQAEVRESRYRATKDLKKAVRDSEKAWEKAEKVVTELEQQLADPEIYGDHSRIADLAARHGQARKEALAAMEAWETATEQLAAAESSLS